MNYWETYNLSDICRFVTSRTCNIENYISTENMLPNKDGITSLSNIPNGSAIAYQLGDVLISNIRPYFQKIWQANCDGACSADVLCIRANEKADCKYLYYLLSQQKFFDYVMSGAKGCKMPRGDKSQIMQWQISLPPLAEQKRIADILSAIDDKIELNRRINANLEQQAQALYKSWFVDNKKDDWEEGVASDYFNITIGKTPPRKETKWFSTSNKDHVWISISDMGKHGMYLGQSSEYLTQSAIEKFNIVIVPDKTVLLSFKLTIGRVVISDGNVTTNEAIAHFNTNDQNLLEYTYLSLKNYEFSALGSTSSIATAVNSKTIKSMRWIMPNHYLIKQFHEKVGPLFNMIRQNEKEINNLSTLRDTLLPKLMSGEITV